MYSYEELKQQKMNGVKLSWKDISPEQLEYLYVKNDVLNSQIARLYDVTTKQVSAKRQKWRIMFKDKVIERMYNEIISKGNINI